MTNRDLSKNTGHADRVIDKFDLTGRSAIVTGGAGMLGLQFAKALAGAGANVALADINVEECKRRAASLALDYTSRFYAFKLDVGQEGSWQELLAGITEAEGRVDILVNNAAFTNTSRAPEYGRAFEDFSVSAWNQMLGVNLTGVFLGCRIVGAEMAKKGKGSIINIASLYGIVSPHHRIYEGTGVSQPVAYSVSKAGVLALTRYVATYWAESGVRVNAITPGGVFDDHSDSFTSRYGRLSPIGRMADRTEMTGALLYLASDASSYTVGHNLVVDGGWTIW